LTIDNFFAGLRPEAPKAVEFGFAGSQIAPQLSLLERQLLGRRRIVNVLRRHGIATWRTLEQKISDASPGGMRIDPEPRNATKPV
jgi:hypothetical protein